MSQDTIVKSKVIYKRLIPYVKPMWMIILVGLITTGLYATVDAIFIYYLKPLLDKGFIGRDLEFIRYVPYIILSLFLFRGLTSFVSSYAMTYVARHIVMVFRQQLFSHFLKLPAKFYDKSTTGQLLSKLLYDVEQFAQIGMEALATATQSICLVIGCFVVMFLNSWQLSLIYLIVAPAIAIIVKVTSFRIRKISYSAQKTMGEVTEIAEEIIEGNRVVKLYGGQDYETSKFDVVSRTSKKRDLQVAVARAINISGVQFVAAIGMSIIIYFAISPQMVTQMTAGSFSAMVGAMLAILKPLKNLTTVNSTIQRGLAGAQSVFETIDIKPEGDTGTKCLSNIKGHIQFHNASFSYETKRSFALTNINLDIVPGTKIAFVGKSGCGKSTLVNLLPRFYELTKGSITIDGHDIKEASLESLRAQLAFVSQDITLFNDTVLKNIAYGAGTAVTRKEIEKLARVAQAYDFIMQLPDGFDTHIGENGVLLSGGQRQRLAIARALIKNAPILILDEATSALDAHSENALSGALDELMTNRTTLIIAHRLSTTQNADLIVMMSAGEVIEMGTHKSLIAKGGAYAILVNAQRQIIDEAVLV